MSNKTELQNNNLELQEILADINALPNAGGGSAIETCTIRVTTPNGEEVGVYSYAFTLFENGAIATDISKDGGHVLGWSDFVQDNVVCGSAFAITFPGDVPSEVEVEVDGGAVGCFAQVDAYGCITGIAPTTAGTLILNLYY